MGAAGSKDLKIFFKLRGFEVFHNAAGGRVGLTGIRVQQGVLLGHTVVTGTCLLNDPLRHTQVSRGLYKSHPTLACSSPCRADGRFPF